MRNDPFLRLRFWVSIAPTSDLVPTSVPGPARPDQAPVREVFSVPAPYAIQNDRNLTANAIRPYKSAAIPSSAPLPDADTFPAQPNVLYPVGKRLFEAVSSKMAYPVFTSTPDLREDRLYTTVYSITCNNDRADSFSTTICVDSPHRGCVTSEFGYTLGPPPTETFDPRLAPFLSIELSNPVTSSYTPAPFLRPAIDLTQAVADTSSLFSAMRMNLPNIRGADLDLAAGLLNPNAPGAHASHASVLLKLMLLTDTAHPVPFTDSTGDLRDIAYRPTPGAGPVFGPTLFPATPFAVARGSRVNARAVTLSTFLQVASGRVVADAGWTPSQWGASVALVPVRAAYLGELNANCVWALAHLPAPYVATQWLAQVWENTNQQWIIPTGGATFWRPFSNQVAVAAHGPNLLFVVVDVQDAFNGDVQFPGPIAVNTVANSIVGGLSVDIEPALNGFVLSFVAGAGPVDDALNHGFERYRAIDDDQTTWDNAWRMYVETTNRWKPMTASAEGAAVRVWHRVNTQIPLPGYTTGVPSAANAYALWSTPAHTYSRQMDPSRMDVCMPTHIMPAERDLHYVLLGAHLLSTATHLPRVYSVILPPTVLLSSCAAAATTLTAVADEISQGYGLSQLTLSGAPAPGTNAVRLLGKFGRDVAMALQGQSSALTVIYWASRGPQLWPGEAVRDSWQVLPAVRLSAAARAISTGVNYLRTYGSKLVLDPKLERSVGYVNVGVVRTRFVVFPQLLRYSHRAHPHTAPLLRGLSSSDAGEDGVSNIAVFWVGAPGRGVAWQIPSQTAPPWGAICGHAIQRGTRPEGWRAVALTSSALPVVGAPAEDYAALSVMVRDDAHLAAYSEATGYRHRVVTSGPEFPVQWFVSTDAEQAPDGEEVGGAFRY